MDRAVQPTDPNASEPLIDALPGLAAPAAIRRILVTTAWFGGVLALIAGALLGWAWALGFAAGTLVGAANLLFLALLARLVLVSGRRNVPRILAVLSIKVLIVYGGLAALLLWKTPPTVPVVLGFSLVLIVITLKAAGRALLSSDSMRIEAPSTPTESADREA